MTYTIGMLGPLETAQFREFLDPSVWTDGVPAGTGGTPVGLLSTELLRRGRCLLAVTVDPSVSEEVILEGPNLKMCFGPCRPDRAHDFFRAERAYLLRVLRRERPDVVHAQWTYEHALAAQASRLPHVITAHDAVLRVLRYNFIPYRIARTLMAYRVLSRAKRVVSVSPHVAAHISRYMLYRGRDEVIPNGMPESLFALRPTTRPTGRRPVTFAAVLQGWGARKNGRAALEAFAIMRRRHPDTKLIMFGYGHGRGEDAERWATSRQLSEGVDFAGARPYSEVMNRLAHEVDALVHPALEEANPMVLLEAMTLGLPTIAGTNSDGTRWTLDDGNAGILVDVTDPRAIATAMERLAVDADERERWSLRGLELATRRYHIRNVTDSYEDVYTELLART
jgi:glycosyltransferase involved in cell wall biosynthesis